jgi:hypothetical protein
MTSKHRVVVAIFVGLIPLVLMPQTRGASDEVKEVRFSGPRNVTIKLRMEGPYTADVPLQVVCYFAYTPEGAKRMSGAPVELDKELGGVIDAVRERGEFVGDELETLLILSPPNSIKARALLLVGLGKENDLSLATMERVGRVALREAARLAARRVAFAPLLRDQGNSKLGTADVESAVTRGVVLAYDTERRLQEEGLAKPYTLDEWIVEAGPAYFDDTQAGVKQAIEEATAMAAKRPSAPHRIAQSAGQSK